MRKGRRWVETLHLGHVNTGKRRCHPIDGVEMLGHLVHPIVEPFLHTHTNTPPCANNVMSCQPMPFLVCPSCGCTP
jgi:hypothetical protein